MVRENTEREGVKGGKGRGEERERKGERGTEGEM
jgi:hypothetical protein